MDENCFKVYTMVSGRVMELTVDMEQRKCLIRRGILESDLDFPSHCKRDYRIGRSLFSQIMQATKGFEKEVVDGVAEKECGFVVPKSAVWSALRQEIDAKKMETIAYFDKGEYEPDDYYDYGVLSRGFQRYCNGEIGGQYFAEWCYVCEYCFKHMRGIKNSRLLGAYSELGDLFETLGFFSSPKSKTEFEIWRKDALARLRYCNFKIECAKNCLRADFTTNGVVTYVTFAFYSEGGNRPISRVCVADIEKKKFNCFYTPEFVYDEDVNYSFVGAEEMDRVLASYINYKVDGTMKAGYAKKKGES